MNKTSKISLKLAISMILSSPSVYANPTGAEIINGQVSIDNSIPGVMSITNSPNAIINWQGFSINQNEISRFIQQNGQSALLNRVIGQNPSEILGQLVSNGRVFLINPNGMVFGANSIVNTQGLLASTLNLSNDDFLSGNYHFSASNSAGNILNEGIIRAGVDGNIILIAPNIDNNGSIQTEGGKITLAAGEELVLTNLDEPEIKFQIQAPENQVLNLGKVLTEGGAIELFAGTISHSGELSTNSIEIDQQGQIRLIAQQDINLTASSITSVNNTVGDAGDIEIKSLEGTTLVAGQVSAVNEQEAGGHIEILGHHVGLVEHAHISASGVSGGGDVLIGGDYKGGNPEVMNAEATYVGEQVSIKADAVTSGDGGKVIVWANETTRVHGSISVTGGAEFGNGGFVETSGHYLEVTSTPDASAINGLGGAWLLDPYNITISDDDTSNNTNIPNFTPTDNSSVIEHDDIQDALSANIDVTIDTGVDGAEDGNVTFDYYILHSLRPGDSPTLTVNAAGSIIFDMSGFNDGYIDTYTTSAGATLNINLNADTDNNGNGGIFLNGSYIDNTGDTNLTTGSGAISLGAGGYIRVRTVGDITLQADDLILSTTSFISSDTGNVTITPYSTTQDIHIGNTGTGDLAITETELGLITAADTLTIGRSTDTGTLTIANGTALTSAVLNINTLSLKNGNIVIDESINFSTENENLNLTARNLIDINASVTTGNGLFNINSPTVNLNPASGTIVINGDISTNTINLDGLGKYDLLKSYTLNAVNHSSGDLQSSNGSLQTITNGYNWSGGAFNNTLTISGDSYISSGVTLTSTLDNYGSLTWNSGDIIGSTGNINNNVAATFSINSDNSFDGAFTNNGTLTKTAGSGTTDFIGIFASNTGIVNADSGTLSFSNGYSQTTGVTSLAGGNITDLEGVTNINAGNLTGDGTFNTSTLNINSSAIFTPGDSFIATGTINNLGVVTKSGGGLLQFSNPFNNLNGGVVNLINGTLDLNNAANTYDGAFNISSGTLLGISNNSGGNLLFSSSASVNGAGNVIFGQSGGGQVAFNTGSVYNISGKTTLLDGSLIFNTPAVTGDLGLLGGSGISGTGTVTTNGLFNWTTGGVVNNLTANGNTIVSGNVILGGTFDNNGTLTWNAGNISGSTGIFNNKAAAGFIIESNNLFEPTFINAGTLNKGVVTGVSQFISPFNNIGTVNVNTGTISFENGYSQTTGLTNLDGGNISDLLGVTNFDGGLLKGSGTFTTGLLNINSGAMFAPGSSPGMFNVEGDLLLAGTTFVEIQGLNQGTQYDFINVTGNVLLRGGLDVTTTAFPGQAFGDAFDIIRANGAISGSFANSQFNNGFNYGHLITSIPTYTLFASLQDVVETSIIIISSSGIRLTDPIIGILQPAINSSLPYESATIDGAFGMDDSDKAIIIVPNILKQCI